MKKLLLWFRDNSNTSASDKKIADKALKDLKDTLK